MTFNPDLCSGCPLEGLYEPLESRGPKEARILILTDIPSMASASEDRLLTKHQMSLLSKKLIDAGFEKNDFRFSPACHCALDPNEHVQKTKTAALKHCRQHFLSEVENHPDLEAIVPLGATAATQAFGRATKITKVRGIVTHSEELNAPVFPLMSPGLVVMYPQNEPVFDADIASLVRSVDAGYDVAKAASQQIGDYQIVTDLQFLIDMDPEVLSFDTETTGLRWYQSGCDVRSYKPELHKGREFFRPKFQILTMQFSVEQGKGYMLVWDHPESPTPQEDKPRLRNQLRQLLCDPKRIVTGHNTKADNVWLWMAEGIRFRIGGDTLMLATLLDENMPERNLDILTKIYVPEMASYADVFNNTYDKSKMWEVPLKELVSYGCGDSDAVYRLYHVLEAKVMEDEKLWANYCRVTIPGLNAFAAMETRGMFIDEGSALAEFKTAMITDVAKQETDLLRELSKPLKQAIVSEYLNKRGTKGQLINKGKTAEDALSFSRPDFVKEILFTHKKGFRLKPKVFTKTTARLNDEKLREPSTSAKDHLPYFFEECPFTEALAKYQKDRHLLNTNVVKFSENYIRDGKIRPNYHLHKAVTGRSTSDDPNGQNVPVRGAVAKAYGETFVAPEGCYIIKCDLSQAELRVVAHMSDDKTLIGIYRRGEDVHKMTALIAANMTQAQFDALPKGEQKVLRQGAKAVNFGLVYGMWWRKFIGYAKTQYGVEFTETEAKRIHSGYFNKYKGVGPWHERQRNLAQKHKQVRSLSGRIRHLPMIDSSEEFIQQEAGRQAINSPVQNFASELGVMALGRMNEVIDPAAMQIVGFIHDALVAYVPYAYLDWGMKTMKRYMETNPIREWFGVNLKVPIVADAGFGLNLGEIHECEGFSLDEPFDYTSLTDKEGNLLIDVPRQKTPPNNGRLTRSAYTMPEDLEDEDVEITPVRYRMVRASVSEKVVKRIERSKRQMVRNVRLRTVRLEAEKAKRAQPVVRRTR